MDIAYNSLIHAVSQQTCTKCKLNETPWNNERRATQSPMRKFKVIEPTLNINQSERYLVGFHFNQFGTLLGGARFICHTFLNKDHPDIYIYIYIYIHAYIYARVP